MRNKIILLVVCFLCLTGCFKKDEFEEISIYTTVYPIEYITNRLYGTHSNIASIYPDGVDVNDYELTEKFIKEYSKTTLFIFDGLSEEKQYVNSFFKLNRGLKIIDATASMEIENETPELWLNPSNFLMIAQNIRYGLKEYIDNHYLKTEIDENFNKLKEEVSRMDADMYELGENASKKTIVVSSDVFKFLEKYGFTVISLEENDNLTEKTIADVIDLIDNGKVKTIFLKQKEEMNDTIKKIVDEKDINVVYLHTLYNLTGDERNSKKDYISIMSDNIDLIKNEVYD